MPYSLDTTTYHSPNFDARPKGVTPDAICIHTTEGWWPSDAAWLCNPDAGVSTHYVIPPTGTIIYQLVGDSKRAWHAGTSSYNGRSNWNDFSIGIEVSHLKGQPWPAGQKDTTAALCRYLLAHFPILQPNIAAHRWVATPAGRKQDPTDWNDAELDAWIASLYTPTVVRYTVVSPCAIFTARDPSSPLAGGPNDGQTWLEVGDSINGEAQPQDGWVWCSPNATDPPGIGFLPVAYVRPI